MTTDVLPFELLIIVQLNVERPYRRRSTNDLANFPLDYATNFADYVANFPHFFPNLANWKGNLMKGRCNYLYSTQVLVISSVFCFLYFL
uniref:Uncharacterized protein n=1 Tax=Romanomermis culicivorax TaxID=13658 RepID=A0A915ICN9_ROMCU